MSTEIHPTAIIESGAELDAGVTVGAYAYIGACVKIRKGTEVMHHATVHCATKEGTETIVGDNNLILAYSHIAHECIVGNYLVMSSHAALGGHVEIGDCVNIAWGAGLHQFCRVGDHAMVGAASKVVQDVPPFMIADGNPAMVRTTNKIGLERAGFSPDNVNLARRVFKIFYKEGLNRRQASERLSAEMDADNEIVKKFITFVQGSERGLS